MDKKYLIGIFLVKVHNWDFELKFPYLKGQKGPKIGKLGCSKIAGYIRDYGYNFQKSGLISILRFSRIWAYKIV